MGAKDGLLAGGVVVAIVLSAFAFLSRPGDAPEPPKPAAASRPEVPAELERKLASVEARVERIEDALGRIEKAVKKAAEERVADLELRKPPAPAPAEVDIPGNVVIDVPEVVRDLGLEGLLRDRLGPGARHVTLGGGGDPTSKLAKALDLTADQRARVREILDEFKEAVDDRLPGGRGVAVAGRGGGMGDTLRKLQAELKGRIAKVLDAEQKRKLDEFVASEGLPIAGTNTLYRIRETPGGGIAVSATSVRSTNNQTRIEIRTDDAGAPAPPPAGGDIGDPAGVF
ncbi:MAG: hypothetical protein ACYS9X_03415 [Planctomycetota bacterium]|jgi:hypothetical protein